MHFRIITLRRMLGQGKDSAGSVTGRGKNKSAVEHTHCRSGMGIKPSNTLCCSCGGISRICKARSMKACRQISGRKVSKFPATPAEELREGRKHKKLKLAGSNEKYHEQTDCQ